MSEIAEKLEKALELLMTKGWCQGEYSCGGRFCGVGACYEIDFWPPPGQTVNSFLSQFSGENFITWQDRPERTFAEVRSVFLKAIEANR